MRSLLWLLPMMLVLSGGLWAQETYTLQRLNSGLDIELQPRTDHHRIHFRLRVNGLEGKTAFAKIKIARPDTNDSMSEAVQLFSITEPSEVWSIFLRVPRFQSADATYTLYFGRHDITAVDEYQAKSGFRWIIKRDPSGQASIVTQEDGHPLPVQLAVRTAVQIGGEIRIVSETRLQALDGIRLGTFESDRAVDGDEVARRVN